MAAKTSVLAENIVKYVGGQGNISSLTHCATRLRFILNDTEKANKEELEKLDVLRIIEASGQFQVVIGPQVGAVYDEVMKIVKINEGKENSTSESKMSKLEMISDVISGSFTPLIPILCGSGLLKAFLAIMTMFNLMSANTGTYAILSAASNALFYFMPIILGFSLARKIGASPYIAAVIAAALLEPNFTNLLAGGADESSFLGIPVLLSDYSSTVFPAFVAVLLFGQLEKLLKKIIPEQFHLLLVPLISLIIMVPFTVLVCGPLGIYVGQGVSIAMNFLVERSAILSGLVGGALWIPIVVFGLHWAIIPVMISNMTLNGFDPLLGLLMGSVFASGGAAFGVFLKTKNKKLKQIAFSSTLPAVLSGISEPIIYGIFFVYQRVFAYAIIMAGVSGAVGGLFGVKATQLAGGIFTIPTYTPVLGYVVEILVAFLGTAALVLIFGIGNEKEEKATMK